MSESTDLKPPAPIEKLKIATPFEGDPLAVKLEVIQKSGKVKVPTEYIDAMNSEENTKVINNLVDFLRLDAKKDPFDDNHKRHGWRDALVALGPAGAELYKDSQENAFNMNRLIYAGPNVTVLGLVPGLDEQLSDKLLDLGDEITNTIAGKRDAYENPPVDPALTDPKAIRDAQYEYRLDVIRTNEKLIADTLTLLGKPGSEMIEIPSYYNPEEEKSNVNEKSGGMPIQGRNRMQEPLRQK